MVKQESGDAVESMVRKSVLPSVSAALLRYRIFSYLAGVVLLLFTGLVVYKFIVIPIFLPHAVMPSWYTYVPQIHGIVFLVYVLMTVSLSSKLRWGAAKTLVTIIAGTVPFMSFFVEKRRTREVEQLNASQ